jgi:glutathione-regulated potassium-efflux system ancillary protein KefF
LRYGNGMNAKLQTEVPRQAQNQAPDIYLIAAHPNWRASRVNRPTMDEARKLPRVQVQDLYASYPDYSIDVPREQAALARAQLLVLMHPIQWYSMPALQKLWLDEVLTYGWAYGGGSANEETGSTGAGTALRGKDLWLVATTGGPEDSYHPQGYNRYFFDAFLPPYEQTAALCGMRFLPPLVLHGAHSASPQDLEQHIQTLAQRLQSYPDWPELDEMDACPTCDVPTRDRPATERSAR